MRPNYNRIVALTIIGLFLFSCSEKQTKIGISPIASFDFYLKDSIIIDYLGDLFITDFSIKRKTYLSFDFAQNSIIEFSENGKIILHLKFDGDDPNGFGNTIGGLSYFNDSSIVVQGRKGLFFYGHNGRIINKIEGGKSPIVLLNGQFKIVQTKINGVDHLITLSEDISFYYKEQKEYYLNKKHFSVFNLNTLEREDVIYFDEKSIYFNDNYYYPRSDALFNYNPTDSMLYVTYNLEKLIYVYSSKDFQLRKKIETSPINFNKPTKSTYGVLADDIKSIAIDSRYNNIFISEDTVILQYLIGMKEEDYSFSSVAELNKASLDYYQTYVEVFVDGEKIGADVKIPEDAIEISYVRSLDYILMPVNQEKQNIERDYLVFYVYGLNGI